MELVFPELGGGTFQGLNDAGVETFQGSVDAHVARECGQNTGDALAEQLGVAFEQRRELPVALRAFVKRNGRLDGGMSLLFPSAVLGTSIWFSSMWGDVVGWVTFAAGMTAAPLGYFTYAAKKYLMLGFAHDDLEPAFKSEAEQTREELTVSESAASPRLEKILRRVAVTTVPVALALFGAFVVVETTGWVRAFPWARPLFNAMITTMVVIGPTATISAIAYGLVAKRRRDIDTEFWQRVWMGPIGRFAFALGRKLVGTRTVGSAMTHRATELSLGLAAEQLFDALPREARASLGDLPPVLKRLQADAQSLRKHHDALQEALNDAGDAAAQSIEYAEVRATRDEIKAKLGDAVGALETIRLNLLRLHAGSGSVEGLTTHIGLAAAVSEEVERLLAAKAEMERGLSFPREIATTPA